VQEYVTLAGFLFNIPNLLTGHYSIFIIWLWLVADITRALIG